MPGCRKGGEQAVDAGARYAGEGEGGVWARSSAQWCHFRHWAPEQNSSFRYLQLHGGALDESRRAKRAVETNSRSRVLCLLIFVTFSLSQSDDLRTESL